MSENIKIQRRKRGVKASRVKLEKALINAGFKTQSALAKRIAEVENTDSIPKDIVNRVFREVSVSTHTLERIANVLGIEAYKLYLTNDDIQLPIVASNKEETIDNYDKGIEVASNKVTYSSRWLNRYLVLFSLILCVCLFFVWKWSVKETPINNASITIQNLFPSLEYPSGKYAVALRVSPPLSIMADKLKELLKNDFNVVPRVYMKGENNIQTKNIEHASQVDFVLNLQLIEFGRFWIIESSIIKYPNKIVLARKLLTKSEFLSVNHEDSKELSHTINRFIGKGLSILPNETLPSLAYLKLVAKGLSLLDESNDLHKVKQAQSKFLLAKDINENFSLAKAGICLSYLYESWSGDEKFLLSRANEHCEEAKIEQKQNALVATANGFLLRRTGRLDEAIAYIEQQLINFPSSADLHIEKGNILLEVYRQSGGSKNLLENAKRSLHQAATLEPTLWKSHFFLGLVEWTQGHKRAAIDATSVAVKLNPNDLVLSNMAALSLCIGYIKPAKDYVRQALLKHPNSYLSLEKMSMLNYYSGDFQSAIDYRLKSIANAGESSIHEMWGALADAYYFNGDVGLSLQMYEKALQIIDREYARGNQNLSHRAFRLYYQIKQNKLDSKGYELNESINSDLLSIAQQHTALDNSAIARIALGFYYIGENIYAQEYRQLAGDRCPIYFRLPDW